MTTAQLESKIESIVEERLTERLKEYFGDLEIEPTDEFVEMIRERYASSKKEKVVSHSDVMKKYDLA